LDEFNGQHQAESVLVAHQYPLDAFQRTALDSNPISALQERMGFYVRATRKGLAHGLDLNVGNDRGHACESHQTQDA
jgi:hypothetical protein